MLRYDPAERIQAKHILHHPYFNELDRSMLPDQDYDGTLMFD
jgi:serine/threonine protein kinase